MKIQTRPFNYGHEHEAEWPPLMPDQNAQGFVGYWDSESMTFKEGYPPRKNLSFGKAPYVIPDTIEPYRHPATGQTIESRAALRATDKACGTITTDKKLDPDPSWQKSRWDAIHKDRKEAMHKAVSAIDNGTAPLTEETRALCAQDNERMSKALGMDCFNVAGRKKDERGKRFRGRRS